MAETAKLAPAKSGKETLVKALSDRTTNLFDSDLSWDENSLLGEGSYGKVYRGVCRGSVVAVKVMDNAAIWQSFITELDLMSKISHPNISTFLGACEKDQNFVIVSELLSADLRRFLIEHRSQERPVSDIVKLKLMLDAALGLSWLHCSQPKFIHRDIKLENVLIDREKMVAKVCDFGLSDMMDGKYLRDTGRRKGSALYSAPEILQSQRFTEKCDVYSFGLVLWEVLLDEKAYSHYDRMTGNPNDIFKAFLTAVCHRHERPDLTPVRKKSEKLADLINACWAPSPQERPSFPEVIQEMCRIILALAVPSREGQSVWATYFCNGRSGQDGSLMLDEIKMSVPLETLLDVIYTAADSPHEPSDAELKSMEKLLKHFAREDLPSGEAAVQLTQFGAFCHSVGRLTPDIFHRVHLLTQNRGFFGQLATTEVASKLALFGPGSYLLRFSSNPGSITLSCAPAGQPPGASIQIEHRRIDFDFASGTYYFQGAPERFDTLQPLMNLERIRKVCSKPCSGSPFDPEIFGIGPGGYIQQNYVKT
eukprot:TRINITY_DN5810_c0_g2_i1.p1 TRINITY_DN5810_c0_g2~~TRINITY_DN5810_c0_g2_i1.p1  ORF type:complete len:536 (+),score=149.07 TRINITY_DN5810_c0_g2_i1:84-1691(+)